MVQRGVHPNVPLTGYGLLISTLRLIGIDICYKENTLLQRLKLKVYPFLIHLSLMVGTYANFISFSNGSIKIEILLSTFVANFLSAILWHIAYKKRNQIRKITSEFHIFVLHQGWCCSETEIYLNLAIVFVLLIPVLSGFISIVCMHNAPLEYANYYSFGYDFKNKYLLYLLRSVVLELLYIGLFQFPPVIAILNGLMYYKLSKLISKFSHILESATCFDLELYKTVKLAKIQSWLLHLSYQLEETLTWLSFILFFVMITNLYAIMATFMVLDSSSITIALMAESLSPVTLIPTSIVFVVLSSAKITYQTARMKKAFQVLHNSFLCAVATNDKRRQMIEMMMKTDFPVMTAGNIVTLRIALIPSMFGFLLSYGILLTSIRNNISLNQSCSHCPCNCTL